MSGLLNKAKAAVSGESNTNYNNNLKTAAPHGEPTIGRSDGVLGGLTDTTGIHNQTSNGFQSDPRNQDAFTSHHHNHSNTIGGNSSLGGSGLGGSNTLGGSRTTDTAGPHNSNVANKLDPRVDSDRDGRAQGGFMSNNQTSGFGSQHHPGATSAYGSTSTNAGPHDSNVANKLDPRVDSDRDGRGAYGTTHNSSTGGILGSSAHNSSTLGSNNYGSTNAGPHNSNAANKLDPRVDSDRDGRGAYGSTQHATTNLRHSETGAGLPSTQAHSAYDSQANNGPHDSRLTNKLDPRVDSNRDGVPSQGIYNPHGTTAAAALGAGAHNINSSHNNTTAGPHNSNVANKLDPRVDSDRDGRGAIGGNTVGGFGTNQNHGIHGAHNTTGQPIGGFGSHNTSTNAGPHDSNVANKLDPRVDSDLDNRRNVGSNTVGGFGTTQNHGVHGVHDQSNAPVGGFGTNALNNNNSTGNNTVGGFGTNQNHGIHGAHNTTGQPIGGFGSHNTSTNAGPHDSNVANKLDPRVDSDRDGRNALGNNTVGGIGSTSHGTQNTHGNMPGSFDQTSNSTNSGPHNSNVANKLDPTVDSDLDNRNNRSHGISATALGAGAGGLGHNTAGSGTGGLGNNINSTNNGPHNSNAANKLDPRVDSDRDGRAGHHGTDYPQKYDPLVTSIPGTHTGEPGAPLNTVPKVSAADLADADTSALGHHRNTAKTTGMDGHGVSGSHGSTGHNSHNSHNNHGTTTGLDSHNNTTGLNSHNNTTGLNSQNNNGLNNHGNTAGLNSHNNTTGLNSHNNAGINSSSGLNRQNDTTGLNNTSGLNSHNNATGLNNHSNTTGLNSHNNTTGLNNHGNTTGLNNHNNTGLNSHNNTTGLNNHNNTGLDGSSGLNRHNESSGLNSHNNTTGLNNRNTAGLNSNNNNASALNRTDGVNSQHNHGTGTAHGLNSHNNTTGLNNHNNTAGLNNHGNTTSPLNRTDGVNSHNSHGTTSGVNNHNNTPGPAPKTAGPHSKDLLNKLDPRVDSNLDGSKTIGGDKTDAAI